VAILNLYSVSHFGIWFVAGRWFMTSWPLFLAFSIGWEALELVLPFEFAVETWDNKIADLVVNCIGFQCGLWSRERRPTTIRD